MRQRLVTLLTALSLLLCVAGCYSYRTVAVTVVDAETGRPIRGAVVDTHYEVGMAHISPVKSRGVTGGNGKTRVRVAKDPQGIFIIPRAKGYLNYWAGGVLLDGRPSASSPYNPDAYTELPRWPFNAATLTLYSEPAAEVVLVVPDGYRGLVPVSKRHRHGNPTPGRRHFEIAWLPGTTARMADVPRMTWLAPTVTGVRCASGPALPWRPKGSDEVGWWRTGTADQPRDHGVIHILIGTREEYRAHSERVVAALWATSTRGRNVSTTVRTRAP